MDEIGPTDHRADPTGPTRTRDSSWIVLVAGVAFVIAVTATFSILMTRDDNDAKPPAFSSVVIDNFDRPASADGLGSGWRQDAGGWAVEGGFALLRTPVTKGDNLTTYELGGTGQSVNLKVGSRSQCGVTVRYQDPFNYLALVRAAPFAVWNVVEMADGVESIIAKVPDEDAETVSVTITVTDRLLSASVGLKTLTLVRANAPTGTRFGLIARGDDVTACTWDDVTAQRAN